MDRKYLLVEHTGSFWPNRNPCIECIRTLHRKKSSNARCRNSPSLYSDSCQECEVSEPECQQVPKQLWGVARLLINYRLDIPKDDKPRRLSILKTAGELFGDAAELLLHQLTIDTLRETRSLRELEAMKMRWELEFVPATEKLRLIEAAQPRRVEDEVLAMLQTAVALLRSSTDPSAARTGHADRPS